MEKTYTVIFKDGRKQIVTGKIFLFSETSVGVAHIHNATYLNASEVISVIKQPSEKGGE